MKSAKVESQPFHTFTCLGANVTFSKMSMTMLGNLIPQQVKVFFLATHFLVDHIMCLKKYIKKWSIP